MEFLQSLLGGLSGIVNGIGIGNDEEDGNTTDFDNNSKHDDLIGKEIEFNIPVLGRDSSLARKNSLTVKVERVIASGGFAKVYLVKRKSEVKTKKRHRRRRRKQLPVVVAADGAVAGVDSNREGKNVREEREGEEDEEEEEEHHQHHQQKQAGNNANRGNADARHEVTNDDAQDGDGDDDVGNDDDDGNEINYMERRYFAVKRLILGDVEQEQAALKELMTHQLLGGASPCHPSIVPLLDRKIILQAANMESGARTRSRSADRERGREVGGKGKEAFLLQPAYEGGLLIDRILDLERQIGKDPPKFGFQRFIQDMISIVSAVAALHALGIAHLDLKPHNIIYDCKVSKENGDLIREVPVVIDMGSAWGPPLAHRIETKIEAMQLQEYAAQHMSAPYRAPEFWNVETTTTTNTKLCGGKADVFSLGCILYAGAIGHGFSPFEDKKAGLLSVPIQTASFSFPEQLALFPLVANPTSHARHSQVEAEGDPVSAVSEVRDTGNKMPVKSAKPDTKPAKSTKFNDPVESTLAKIITKCLKLEPSKRPNAAELAAKLQNLQLAILQHCADEANPVFDADFDDAFP